MNFGALHNLKMQIHFLNSDADIWGDSQNKIVSQEYSCSFIPNNLLKQNNKVAPLVLTQSHQAYG